MTDKCYPVPGYQVELVGCYTEGVKQSDIEDDISFTEEMRHDR